MSLHAWGCEDEDKASTRPRPSQSGFSGSVSECDVADLNAAAQAPGSEHQCSSIASSDGPASISNSEEPQVVPCNFIISLAFPVNIGEKNSQTLKGGEQGSKLIQDASIEVPRADHCT